MQVRGSILWGRVTFSVKRFANEADRPFEIDIFGTTAAALQCLVAARGKGCVPTDAAWRRHVRNLRALGLKIEESRDLDGRVRFTLRDRVMVVRTGRGG